MADDQRRYPPVQSLAAATIAASRQMRRGLATTGSVEQQAGTHRASVMSSPTAGVGTGCNAMQSVVAAPCSSVLRKLRRRNHFTLINTMQKHPDPDQNPNGRPWQIDSGQRSQVTPRHYAVGTKGRNGDAGDSIPCRDSHRAEDGVDHFVDDIIASQIRVHNTRVAGDDDHTRPCQSRHTAPPCERTMTVLSVYRINCSQQREDVPCPQ
jgi:hypothetical protein